VKVGRRIRLRNLYRLLLQGTRKKKGPQSMEKTLAQLHGKHHPGLFGGVGSGAEQKDQKKDREIVRPNLFR